MGDEEKEDRDDKPEVSVTKTFTQEEVNSIMAREKEQGRRSASSSLAEELGVSVEEAKKIIQAQTDREEQEKSEAQKARDAANKEKSEAEKAKAEAAKERHEAKVERMMLRARVDPDRLDRLVRLASIDVGADDEAIKAEVESIKKDFPESFAAEFDASKEEDKGKPKPPNSDGSGTPPKGKTGGDDLMKKGMERAQHDEVADKDSFIFG